MHSYQDTIYEFDAFIKNSLNECSSHTIYEYIYNKIKPFFNDLLRSIFYGKFKNEFLYLKDYIDISEQIFRNQYYYPDFFKKMYYIVQVLRSDAALKLAEQYSNDKFDLVEYVITLKNIEEDVRELFHVSQEHGNGFYIEISPREKRFLKNLYKLVKSFYTSEVFCHK